MTGEAALLALIGTDPDNDGGIEIVLVAADGSTLRLSRDTRHGLHGWRASRYVENIWDNSYLFFPMLAQAIDAAGNTPGDSICGARVAF